MINFSHFSRLFRKSIMSKSAAGILTSLRYHSSPSPALQLSAIVRARPSNNMTKRHKGVCDLCHWPASCMLSLSFVLHSKLLSSSQVWPILILDRKPNVASSPSSCRSTGWTPVPTAVLLHIFVAQRSLGFEPSSARPACAPSLASTLADDLPSWTLETRRVVWTKLNNQAARSATMHVPFAATAWWQHPSSINNSIGKGYLHTSSHWTSHAVHVRRTIVRWVNSSHVCKVRVFAKSHCVPPGTS